MYMPNIKFFHRKEKNFSHELVNIAAEIIYKDDDIILSKSTMYNKPHILLGTGNALINYGFVAFNELEIEPKGGSVGLILNINDIEVTPSREAPVWSTKTREAVIKKYDAVTKTATKLVESQLKNETDYIKWLGTAAATIHSLRNNVSSGDSVVSRLASIIDVSAISDLRFPGNNSISFSTDVKEMLGEYVTAWNVKYDSFNKKIDRKKIKSISELNRPIYHVGLSAKGTTDRYLFEENGEFIQIRIKEGADKDKYAKNVLASKMIDYSEVVVPQSRLDLYESEDLNVEEENTVVASVAAKNRKLNQEIIVHTLKRGSTSDNRYYSFAQREQKIADLFQLNTEALCLYTIYGERNTLHDVVEMLPSTTLSMNRFSQDNAIDVFGSDEKSINAVMIASENKKYLESCSNFTELNKFIISEFKDGKLEFSKHIKYAASAAFIQEIVKEKYKLVIEGLKDEAFSAVHKEDCIKFNTFFEHWYDSNNRPKRGATKQPWFSDCIRFHAGKLGLIDLSAKESEDLLETIEDGIPDVLCNDINDEILDINILDKEFINDIIDIIKYYSPVATLIKNIGSGYNQDSSEIEENAKKVSYLCKVLQENPGVLDGWNFPNYKGEEINANDE